jgi:predicted transcriptional regulator
MEAKIYKTSVNLPQEAVDALKELAERKGISQSEVLRQAISTEKFFQDTQQQGGKILTQLPDGSIRQILKR